MRAQIRLLALVAGIVAWSGCPGPTLNLMPQATRSAQTLLRMGHPVAAWDHAVAFDDADIVRFVDDQRLLVGSVHLMRHGRPRLGPLVMYDHVQRRELWRLSRGSASYDVVATSPVILLRSTSGSRVMYKALVPATGRVQWQRKVSRDCETRFDVGATGLSGVYQLCGGSLVRVDARTGAITWRAQVPGPTSPDKRRLILAVDSIYVVDTKRIHAMQRSNGAVRWRARQDISAPFEVAASGDGIFVYGANQAAWHLASSGARRWFWIPPGGGIKLVSAKGGTVFAVVHRPSNRTDAIYAIDHQTGNTVWHQQLPGHVVAPLVMHDDVLYTTVGGLTRVEMGMRNAPIYRDWYTTSRTLVGFSRTDGAPRLKLSLPSFPGGKNQFPTQPDRLLVHDGSLRIARADYGITVVDLASGRISWNQRHRALEGPYRRSLLYLSFSGTKMKAYWSGGALSLSAPRPNASLSRAQASLDTTLADAKRVLSNPKASQAARQSARLSIRIAVGSQLANMRISQTMARVQSAANVAIGIMNLANALASFWTADLAAARAAWYHKAVLGLRIAATQHANTFGGRYYLRANRKILTLVDLESGRASHLVLSPQMDQVRADMSAAALSPNGKYVAAVAVGLDWQRYQPRTKWNAIAPACSVIVYKVSDLKFFAPPAK